MNYKPHRGRCQTKKYPNNCKLKISIVERQKRKHQKRLAKMFPVWKQLLPFVTNSDNDITVRKQHSPLILSLSKDRNSPK